MIESVNLHEQYIADNILSLFYRMSCTLKHWIINYFDVDDILNIIFEKRYVKKAVFTSLYTQSLFHRKVSSHESENLSSRYIQYIIYTFSATDFLSQRKYQKCFLCCKTYMAKCQSVEIRRNFLPHARLFSFRLKNTFSLSTISFRFCLYAVILWAICIVINLTRYSKSI